MGRKITKQWILLLILLAVLYSQQELFTQAKYAEEPAESEKEIQKESAPFEEIPGEGQEEPEPEPEPLKKYKLQYEKPNGKNGFYIRKPSIQITHVSNRGCTKYEFTDGNGTLTKGELNEEADNIVLDKTMFCEGKNVLRIYMEEDKMAVDGMTEQLEFWIDSQEPELSVSVPAGFDAWYQKETVISAAGMDGPNGSGIQNVSCYVGEVLISRYESDSGLFLINWASAGGRPVEVTVCATDRAGNMTYMMRDLYIDHMPPQIEITGVEDYMITREAVNPIFIAQEENEWKDLKVLTTWVDTDGNKKQTEAEGWREENGKRVLSQTIENDGMYRLEILASDQAGFESRSSVQIIIDKSQPVISYVEELDGQYLKEFMWQRPLEETVKDFTSCVSEIWLDGKLYPIGKKITKEGTHRLKVQAIDAAGNFTEKSAVFTIDHTAPEIIFADLEGGSAYEEEKEVRISLASEDDWIESVMINGKKAELKKNTNTFHCVLKEFCDYEVSARAVDKAGNKSEKSIIFEVVPEKTILQKILEPMKQTLGIEEKSFPIKETANQAVKKQTQIWNSKVHTIVLVIIGAFVLILTGIYLSLNKKQ